jgi:hypothetical protein
MLVLCCCPGLEIVLVAGLLTFGDYSEQLRATPNETTQSSANMPTVVAPPYLPLMPDGWKEDQIAILQPKEQVGAPPYILSLRCGPNVVDCIASVM